MAVLRAPHGCPWDRKQSHESLRSFLLEETYEAIDAIDRGDIDDLGGELGDVLFQCVFHAELARESGRFDIADVVDRVTAKLVSRHPHVFTAAGRPLTAAARRRVGIESPEAVKEQWERIKAGERTKAGRTRRVLAGIPRALPALVRAQKIGTRVATVGFDWPKADAIVDKIEEEVRELRAAFDAGRGQTVEEMGDLLFSIANLARKLRIDPEAALSHANDKFTRRFDAVETHLERQGRDVHEAAPDELEAAWTAIKPVVATRAASSSGLRASKSGGRGRRSRR